jgi:asparagine synthase (glutamine-hydrolysing)
VKLIPAPIRKALHRTLTGRDLRGLNRASGFLMSKLALGSQVAGGAALAKAALLLEAGDLGECYDLISSCWQHPESVATTGSMRPRHWPNKSPLDSMLLADQMDYLPGDSLAKVDRASMAASLETRLPLLDHRIVELGWRVPDRMKIDGNDSKVLMRSVLYRLVPKELIERPKMGFSVPLDAWLRGPLKQWAGEALHNPGFLRQANLSHADIDTTWKHFLQGKRFTAYQMWSVVLLAAWINENSAH